MEGVHEPVAGRVFFEYNTRVLTLEVHKCRRWIVFADCKVPRLGNIAQLSIDKPCLEALQQQGFGPSNLSTSVTYNIPPLTLGFTQDRNTASHCCCANVVEQQLEIFGWIQVIPRKFRQIMLTVQFYAQL